MLTEIQVLLGLAAVTLVLIVLQGAQTPILHGFSYGLGARDEEKARSVFQGRMMRTIDNHMQGMLMFVPLVVAIVSLDASTELSRMGATLYLAMRVLFSGLYLAGVPVLRSFAWGLAVTGLVMMAWSVSPVAFG